MSRDTTIYTLMAVVRFKVSLKDDLIDEMVITRVPILLGNGFPLFGKLNQSLNFRHIKTKIYHNSLVQSYYTRDR